MNHAIYLISPGGDAMPPDLACETLHQLWDMLVDDGLVSTVFYEGRVTNAAAFAALMFSPLTVCYAAFGPGSRPAGLAWLNAQEGKAARLHFCFFRHARRHALALGRLFTRFLLTARDEGGESYLETLYAGVPQSNRPALSLARKLGFRTMGVLPGAAYIAEADRLEGLVLSRLTREEVLAHG